MLQRRRALVRYYYICCFWLITRWVVCQWVSKSNLISRKERNLTTHDYYCCLAGDYHDLFINSHFLPSFSQDSWGLNQFLTLLWTQWHLKQRLVIKIIWHSTIHLHEPHEMLPTTYTCTTFLSRSRPQKTCVITLFKPFLFLMRDWLGLTHIYALPPWVINKSERLIQSFLP